MGRGRAKAKQTKVARELKYSSHDMDLDALQRELRGPGFVHKAEEKPNEEDPTVGLYDDEHDNEYGENYRRH